MFMMEPPFEYKALRMLIILSTPLAGGEADFLKASAGETELTC